MRIKFARREQKPAFVCLQARFARAINSIALKIKMKIKIFLLALRSVHANDRARFTVGTSAALFFLMTTVTIQMKLFLRVLLLFVCTLTMLIS